MLKQQILQGGGYLAICNIPVPAASQLPDTLLAKAGTSHDTDGASAKIVLGGACSSECNDEDDIACVPAERDRSIHFYDYHIVYLPSYSVPTLLFTGRHTGMLRLSVACTQLTVEHSQCSLQPMLDSLSGWSPPNQCSTLNALNASKGSICVSLAFCRFFCMGFCMFLPLLDPLLEDQG